MTDVTRILSAMQAGDSAAAVQLLPLVYAELRDRLSSSHWATMLNSGWPGSIQRRFSSAELGSSY
jgi:hypothetical protein